MILHLAQSVAAQAVGPDLSDVLIRGAAFVVSGAVGYMGREMGKMRKELIEWRVFLVGIDGDNGLNSKVNKIDRRVERLERRHGLPDRRTHQEDE